MKNKFLKQPDFFLDHKEFVEELIDKEYAGKSYQEAPEGRTWYIIHHGVYHPQQA